MLNLIQGLMIASVLRFLLGRIHDPKRNIPVVRILSKILMTITNTFIIMYLFIITALIYHVNHYQEKKVIPKEEMVPVRGARYKLSPTLKDVLWFALRF